MATTLTNATLTVRVIEDVELNGKKSGNTNTHKITGINEVSDRIVTSLITGTTLLSLGASAAAGTYVRDDVRYIRITNLDDTNFVRLALINEGTDVHLKLTALDSILLYNGSAAANDADDNTVSFSNITSIKAWADTASVDLELFVAST